MWTNQIVPRGSLWACQVPITHQPNLPIGECHMAASGSATCHAHILPRVVFTYSTCHARALPQGSLVGSDTPVVGSYLRSI